MSQAENENVLRRLVLVREDQAYPDFTYPDFKVSHALRAASFCYPNWDAHLASSLLKDFGLRANKAIKPVARAAVGPRDHDRARRPRRGDAVR